MLARLLALSLTVAGCDRLECSPVGLPNCPTASVCCRYRGDAINGDCFVQSRCDDPSGECFYTCASDDCFQALEDWALTECE